MFLQFVEKCFRKWQRDVYLLVTLKSPTVSSVYSPTQVDPQEGSVNMRTAVVTSLIGGFEIGLK